MKSLTLGVFLFFAAEITFSQVSTSDQHEVQQTLIKVFEALSARDAAALRKLCTADVRFNEYGDAWTIDTLISKAITKNTAPDFKRVNKLDFISTTIQGDVAWTTYNLHSAITASGKDVGVNWMETAILVQEEKRWKVKVLHSTRITKK